MRHLNGIAPASGIAYSLTLPTQWSEVTLGQYIRLITEPELPLLCCLSSLSRAQVDELPEHESSQLVQEMGFLHDMADLMVLLPAPDLPTVGASSYGQLLLALQYIGQRGEIPLLACAPYIYSLYRSQQIGGIHSDAKVQAMEAAVLASSLPAVWADIQFCLTDLTAFNQRHATDEQETDDYTDDEYEAGFDQIDSRFGAFATLDALSGGDPAKYEQLLKIDAETMITRIRLAQLQRRTQQRLHAIQQAHKH